MNEIPKWHYAMLNDSARNSSFQAAISQQVTTDDRVVDIGTGTGLLSILAARAGALSVDAFEAHPAMAAIAFDTIAASGVDEKIALHSTLSANVAFLTGDRRDMLITEIFDCALIGEGILPTLRHARRSLLTEGYRSIPQTAELHGALVSSPRLRKLNEVGEVCGVDLTGLNQLQTKGHFPVRLGTWPHRIVSEMQPLYHLDLMAEPSESEAWDITFQVSEDSSIDGVVAWFSMDLGSGQTVTSHPSVESHWMQAFIPFPQPMAAAAGDELVIQLSIRDQTDFVAVPTRAPDRTEPSAAADHFEMPMSEIDQQMMKVGAR